MNNNLDSRALIIAREQKFKITKKIYQAFYYTTKKVRNAIYGGVYREREAVLKIYDDPRLTDEPMSLKNFNRLNKSKILIAPRLYKYKIISPKQGWMIIEKLPQGSKNFSSPLSAEDRKKFLELYLEYRSNFPVAPWRKLNLVENLPADYFHDYRIATWLELANDQYAQTQHGPFTPEELTLKLTKGLAAIKKEFSRRRMIWCHGHFKPVEIFLAEKNLFYLTDFAHTRMYPLGYEFGFMIWADYIMAADWRLDYSGWKKGVADWLEALKPIGRELKIKNFTELSRISLIERVICSILTDVYLSNMPKQEKYSRMKMLFKLLDELLDG